ETSSTPDDRVEHCLDVGRRTRDDAQYLGGRGLLVQCLLERAVTRFEFLLQLCSGFASAVNVSSRLRSGRTKLAAARWALCAFERQDHLVGTATGPPSVGPSQGSSLSILTEPRDERAALHLVSAGKLEDTCAGTAPRSPWRGQGQKCHAEICHPV